MTFDSFQNDEKVQATQKLAERLSLLLLDRPLQVFNRSY